MQTIRKGVGIIKRITIIISSFFFLVLLFGCNTKQYDIVTTMYPQYDFARNIVGDKMSVVMLNKPGAEAHGFDPTSQDMQKIKNAKLFVFTSYQMDPWLNDDVSAYISKNTVAINLAEALEILEEDEDHDHDHEHEHEEGDSHFWTNPLIAIEMIEIIYNQIILIDPTNAEYYKSNADNYISQILSVHEQLNDLLLNNEYTIYFAGHNALSSFAEQYDLTIISLSNTFQPDADITSAQLQQLVNQLKENEVKYLYIEEIKQPKIALQIQAQISGLTLLELTSYHNVTKDQFDAGTTYLDLLKANYQNLFISLT